MIEKYTACDSIMSEKLWPDSLDSVVKEFQECFDAMERYELLFEYASKSMNSLPQENWNDDNMIHGCQSRAHVECSLDQDGLFLMRGGADAQIVQGLMEITRIAVDGSNCEDVATLEPVFADAMGFKSALTPSRSNGFKNMIDRVKIEAQRMLEDEI